MNRDQYERKRTQYQEGGELERRPAEHPSKTAPDGTNLGKAS